MFDKIIVHSSRKEAYIIFTDKQPFCIRSDTDVVPILMLLLGHSRAHLVVNGEEVTGIEVRRDCGDEITVKTKWLEVA